MGGRERNMIIIKLNLLETRNPTGNSKKITENSQEGEFPVPDIKSFTKHYNNNSVLLVPESRQTY